jgi:hypothetical protein
MYIYKREKWAEVAQLVLCLTADWTTGVRSPAEVKNFPLASLSRPAPRPHPASYPVGTGDPVPGVKRCWGVTLTTHPHLVPRSSLPCRQHGGRGIAFLRDENYKREVTCVFKQNAWRRICNTGAPFLLFLTSLLDKKQLHVCLFSALDTLLRTPQSRPGYDVEKKCLWIYRGSNPCQRSCTQQLYRLINPESS